MRGKLSRMWRSGISLMLVFCMLISMAPAAFATDSSPEQTTIKYVSLGDSVSLGSGSYPDLFADWLVEEGYADKVEHSALAMEAMRAEDLHFILTYSGANSAVAEGEWDEAAWNKAFPNVGDHYTWKNFTSNGVITKESAKQYQAAVAAADLLTVGIGNANFGDFLMDCVIDAVNGNEAKYDVANAMVGLDASLKTKLMTVYNELLAKLEAKVGNEMAVSLANAMVYTMVGYVVNYEAVLNDIVGLNPDAEVIIVPVINTMDGVEITYNGNTYDIGSYIDNGLKVLNAYLALVATKYENTIFYAEVGEVQLQANVADALSRADIMATVVGTEENPGMIWELLAGKVSDFYADAELEYIKEAQVEEYAALKTATEKANYVIDEETNEVDDDKVDLAISAALYLAFEEAIKASQGNPLSVEGLKDLANSEALINNVVSDITAELDKVSEDAENKKAAEDAAYDVVADKVNKEIYKTLTGEGVDETNAASVTLTVDEVKALLAGQTEPEAIAIIDDLSYEIAVAGIKSKLNISTDEANSIGLNVEGIKAIVANDPAAEALLNDLAYRGIAKAIADGDKEFMNYFSADYVKYVKYLATYGDVKELFDNDNKVNVLIANEVNEQISTELGIVLDDADKLTDSDIALLANEDPADDSSVETKLNNLAQKVIEKNIGDAYINNANNSTAELNSVVSEDDIVALYKGSETPETLAKRIVLEHAEDDALAEIMLNGTKFEAATYVLNQGITDEALKKDAAAVEADYGVDAAVTAAVDTVAKQQTAVKDEYAKACEVLQAVLDDIKAKEAAKKDDIDAKIASMKSEIQSVAKSIADIKNDGLKKAKYGKLEEDGYDGIVATIDSKLADAKTKLNEKIYSGEDYNALVSKNIDNLCKLLGVSEAVVATVKENATLSGLLNIMARCLIGDGLGMLPTAAGHNTIAVAVETSYKTNHTVQDETEENVELAIDKVIEVLEENGMSITATAIQNGLGYITDLDDTVADLKDELQKQVDDYKNGIMPALQGDLAAMQKLLVDLEKNLIELENKLAGLEKKLNDLVNKPDAASSTIEALEKAIAETNAAIASTRNKIAYVNTCIGALNEKLTQMSATLVELQNKIDKMDTAVKGVYAAVSTKDISFHEAFNNLETLRQNAIGAIYTVEELYHELKDLGNDTIKFIDTIKDEAKTAVTVLGGTLVIAYKLLPNNVEDKIKTEADAKIADLKTQIADKKAELEQEVKEEVKAELQKQIDALEAEIEEIKAKAADDIESLGGVNEDAINLINEVLGESYDAIYAEWENVEEVLKNQVNDKNEVIEASAQAVKKLIKFAEEEIEKVIEDAKVIYVDVTNADYTITNSSSYVALGDASAYSASGSYVDILAADPQLALEEAYTNAYSTRTIDEMLADIRGGDIPKGVGAADLITIRFDNSQIVKNAFIHAFIYMKGGDMTTLGWEALIGEKGVAAVNNFLAALEDELEKYGMEDMIMVEMENGLKLPAEGRTLDKAFVHMAEAYLYYSIQYMLSIPEYVAEIHKNNPDAVIIFVGMSNPFGETVLKHENLNIEVGNYMGTIVEYVDMIGKGFCMLFPNATYVSAPNVETSASNVEDMELTKFFYSYIQTQYSTLYPTATGHQYIKDQILKALTITDERTTEPECLLGDVNDDGVVDAFDLLRLHKYLAGYDVKANLKNSEVTGDGIVDAFDLLRLHKYLAGYPVVLG